MLKNYTVIVKNVNIDKRDNLLIYLNDTTHKNHTKKETEILELSSRDKFENITNDKLKKNAAKYKSNKKGGRKLKRVNKSFTFNLPKNYKEIASVEKCKEIDLKLKKEIIKVYALFGIEITLKELYSVLHHQDNPHIHLITPYLDKNGNVIRDINHKGFTNRLKVLFSQIVDNVLNVEIEKYEKLNNLDNGNNKIRQALKEIKSWYETLIRIDGVENKYYKNQILNINRRLEDTQEITQEQFTSISDNMKKASTHRIKNNKSTPQTPYL